VGNFCSNCHFGFSHDRPDFRRKAARGEEAAGEENSQDKSNSGRATSALRSDFGNWSSAPAADRSDPESD
jgi:hypothetical protein